MKKLVWILLFVCVSCSIASAASIPEQIRSLEVQANFSHSGTNLYTYIQERALVQGLTKICSVESIAKGEELAKKINTLLEDYYTPKTDGEQLLLSLQLRDRLHRIHARMSSDDTERLCLRKQVLYRLEGRLRDWHVDILERTDILRDFTEENPPLIGYATKTELMNSYLDPLTAPAWFDLTVEVENSEKLSQLSAEQKALTILSRRVMERAIQEVLDEFETNGRFTAADSDAIRKHVYLEYTDSCTNYNGSYEVRQTLTQAGVITKIETLGLHLKVTTCTKLYILLHLRDIYKKLIYHELGHHVWRYKDPNPTRYTHQCRSNETDRNASCSDRDFVSEYAQQAPEEDYAEHFQQRVLDAPSTSLVMKRKFGYFDELFQ